ncbi:hypothetical protein [Curtobacterium sp. MCPF17_021]|uniref:hypothetical protein n=1 Tax=Curtobacterium sp. MCPF17_021 TaxID=2175639 RepID=UPI000DA89CCE|nr:hypothetical protein [Curtobacterium sp. MCPF17_021]WIE82397.1 hypothetical protein DEJ29_013500 [Curtobacterium sp. MCPF17_021]
MTRQRTNTRRAVIATVLIVSAAALLFIGLRTALLVMGATEGDVPATASIPLPAGSKVVDEEKQCASGGCWSLVSVQPPAGVSPAELSTTLGTEPFARLPGTLWDPRVVNLTSEVQGDLLVIQADYWSRELTP